MIARVPRWAVVLALLALSAVLGYATLRAVSHTGRHARDPAVYRDFDHFYHAARAVAEGQDPYESFRRGYLYPPLLAAVMRPLAELDRNPAYAVWFAINAGTITLALGLSARTLLERFGVRPRAGAVLCVAGFGAVLTFDQLRWQLEQGQTDAVALLAFALGLRWLDRRPLLAGVAMGTAANVKYLTLVAVPFAALRGRWRLVAGIAVGVMVGALLPAVVLGWGDNLASLATSLGRLVHVVDAGPDLVNAGGINVHSLTWEMNVSLPAFAAKTAARAGIDAALVMPAAAGLAGLLVLAAWGIYAHRGARFWRGSRAGDDPRVRCERATLEWLGLIVAALAMSPQTTVRHMVLLTLVYQMAAVMLIAPRPRIRRWLPAAACVLAWLSMSLPPGGGDGWSAVVALPWWRSVAGSMWFALLAYAVVLWCGLGYVKAGAGLGLGVGAGPADQNSDEPVAPPSSSVTPR